MNNPRSLMAQEIEAVPAVVTLQATELARPLGSLLSRLRRQTPSLVVTGARGSSAHAATFAKHLIERYLGLPVAEAAPSIASVYGRRLDLKNQLFLAISQSGSSDDLLALTSDARSSGALTVAITNAPSSALAQICEVVLPIMAGHEQSVAATKTFVATASVLLRLVGAWANQADILRGIEGLPARLAAASKLDWGAACAVCSQTPHLLTLGRGPTLAMAREAALKLKEICGLQAEAYSSAEFLHGPVALIRPNYPVLVFTPADEATAGVRQLCSALSAKGSHLLIADDVNTAGVLLPVLPPEQPEADALCLIQSFYVMAVNLAAQLGVDVDRPRHLHKITRTT